MLSFTGYGYVCVKTSFTDYGTKSILSFSTFICIYVQKKYAIVKNVKWSFYS